MRLALQKVTGFPLKVYNSKLFVSIKFMNLMTILNYCYYLCESETTFIASFLFHKQKYVCVLICT